MTEETKEKKWTWLGGWIRFTILLFFLLIIVVMAFGVYVIPAMDKGWVLSMLNMSGVPGEKGENLNDVVANQIASMNYLLTFLATAGAIGGIGFTIYGFYQSKEIPSIVQREVDRRLEQQKGEILLIAQREIDGKTEQLVRELERRKQEIKDLQVQQEQLQQKVYELERNLNLLELNPMERLGKYLENLVNYEYLLEEYEKNTDIPKEERDRKIKELKRQISYFEDRYSSLLHTLGPIKMKFSPGKGVEVSKLDEEEIDDLKRGV